MIIKRDFIMTTLAIEDLELLYKYASKCKFIIETGGGGDSTKYLSKASILNDSKMITIEIIKKRCKLIDNVEYMNGWSITYDDIIKKGDPSFVDVRKFKKVLKISKDFTDGMIAHGRKELMTGEVDLIRKALKKYSDLELDFFFCDSGEYCGLAEWNIVKNQIKIGGYFAAHDIYYPKSIKCFKVLKKIKKSKKWKIKEKTLSRQGLLIAQRIK